MRVLERPTEGDRQSGIGTRAPQRPMWIALGAVLLAVAVPLWERTAQQSGHSLNGIWLVIPFLYLAFRALGRLQRSPLTAAVAVIALVQFYIPWHWTNLDSTFTSGNFVLPADQRITSIVALAFFTAFLVTAAVFPKLDPPLLHNDDRTRMTLGKAGLVFWIGVGVVVLQVFLAVSFHFALPGRPLQWGLIGSLLSYSIRDVPMAAAMVLLTAAGKFERRAGVILLVLFAVGGAVVGWRQPLFSALGLVLIVQFLAPSARFTPPSQRAWRLFAMAVCVALSLWLVIPYATNQRTSSLAATAAHVDVAHFLRDRLSGARFLAPMVAKVKTDGSDPHRLLPGEWRRYLREDFFNIHSSTISTPAATAPGWWLASMGAWGLVFGGAVSYFGIGIVVRTVRKQAYDRAGDVALLAGAAIYLIDYLVDSVPSGAVIHFLVYSVAFIGLRRFSNSYRWRRSEP